MAQEEAKKEKAEKEEEKVVRPVDNLKLNLFKMKIAKQTVET